MAYICNDITIHIIITFMFIFFLFSSKKHVNFFYNFYFLSIIFFISSMIKDFFSIKKKHFILYYFITFLIILNCNLMGMFPYSFALTSHFSFTFFFSLSFFYALMIIALRFKNIYFFSIFYPSGVPTLMLFLLIPIEFVSYYSRVLSLAIRLFANIMSGHILIKIFSKFCWVSLFSCVFVNSYFFILFYFIFTIIVLVFFLEIMVSFIQSYVFIILKLIYLGEIL